ncbi:hypothetical protein SAMN04490205_3727 [Pseudomonas trivialis]|uniref:Uncharacterized protein n=1 Tax=Pseudomonas trivialis TaxID=200450 RepID=A0ABY0UK77_9PSED|nr:hypothetical protein SAMN04490205_3727 [Pseudomonas trivialis]
MTCFGARAAMLPIWDSEVFTAGHSIETSVQPNNKSATRHR